MKILVENIATEYRDDGAGLVILFLHGWGDDSSTFDPLVAHMRSKFRCIRIDLPGFGASEPPPGIWGVEHYARFVALFTEKTGIKPLAIIGHSFGGRIAIKGFSRGLFHAEKMILIAAAGNANRKRPRNAIFLAIAKTGKLLTALWPFSLLRNSFKRYLYAKANSDYLDAGSMRQTFLTVIREDLSADAAKIRTPSLLIWGERDTTTPIDDGTRLAQTIEGSQMVAIAAAGHFVHRDFPDEVAEIIERFV